jgi:putative DNA primase/helicase
MRGKWMFVVGAGWYRWTGQVWRECPTEEVQQFIQSRYQWMFNKAIERAKTTPEHLIIAQAIAKFLSNSKLKAIIERLHVEKGILESNIEALDAHPDLLNTPEGVVNMRTGKLLPHDPDLKMTKMTRGNYRPGYTHPDWNAALTALPTDIATYMQLRMGQAATGYIPESDDAMFLVGGGSNGKSAWTTDGIFPALGQYAMLANPHLISDHSTSGATPERASLRGGRFVLIEELPEGGHLKAEEIKRITGTSRIRARQLYMQEIEFTASHTLVVTTNYTPQVKETDEGTWRRLLRIPFEYRYVQNPSAPHERKGDPGLRLRLREGRDGQHDAIVTWIIEGAMRYFADPSSIIIEKRPDAVQAATDAWRMQSDRVLAYLGERVELDPESRVAKSDLYSDFCSWLNEGGYGRWSQETFFVRFLAHESVKGRLEIKQTKSHQGISRPGGGSNPFLADLPKVPRVVCGLRFRDE